MELQLNRILLHEERGCALLSLFPIEELDVEFDGTEDLSGLQVDGLGHLGLVAEQGQLSRLPLTTVHPLDGHQMLHLIHLAHNTYIIRTYYVHVRSVCSDLIYDGVCSDSYGKFPGPSCHSG